MTANHDIIKHFHTLILVFWKKNAIMVEL